MRVCLCVCETASACVHFVCACMYGVCARVRMFSVHACGSVLMHTHNIVLDLLLQRQKDKLEINKTFPPDFAPEIILYRHCLGVFVNNGVAVSICHHVSIPCHRKNYATR